MMIRGSRPVFLAALLVVLLAAAWFSRRVLLLSFAAILIALVLTSLTHLLRRLVPLGWKTAYAAVLLLVVTMIAGAAFLMAPSITDQFGELADRIPKLVAELRAKVEESPSFNKIKRNIPDLEKFLPSGGGMAQVFSSTFQMASSAIFIGFAALFLAASPQVYQTMFIRLFPPRKREAAGDTLARVICTLKYWLIGQAVSMSAVGLITGTALAIAGIPFAIALGIIAGLAEFIPIVGPLLSAVPALLLAMSEGMDKVLVVLGILLAVQFLEGNVIMPIAQRKAVDLPPVVTLVSLLVMGEAFGLLGLFVAAPLAAAVLVVTEDVYLRRWLKTDDKLLE